MRRLDDFVIDRLSQPCVDLSPLVSPYALASFLLTGGCGAILAWASWRQEWFIILVSGLWMPMTMWRAYQQDRHPPPYNVMPICRLTGLYLRMWLVSIQLGMLPGYVLSSLYGHHMLPFVGYAAWWLVVIAEYLLACRRRPPAQRSKTPRSLFRGVFAR